MKRIILKIRDKCWFYTNELYPNDTVESNSSDFKIRFAMFFVPLIILIIGLLAWFFSIFLNRPQNYVINNFKVVIPISIAFFFIFNFLFGLILNYLSGFPIDEKNDKGKMKNFSFLMKIIVSELVTVFVIIWILFS